MKSVSRFTICQFAGVAALAILVADTGAAADSLVLREEQTRYKAGDTLKGGKSVRLKRGEKIWLLDENGRISEHAGATVVTIDLGKSESPGLFGSFREMLGVRKSAKRLGGVRGDLNKCPAALSANDVAVLWQKQCKGEALAELDKILD
jgi:hypothetical protein